MKLPDLSCALLHHRDDEQIDVLRIRLWNSMKATAVLSDFYSTDRVLANWAQTSCCSGVRYEVSFVDGFVVKGYHVFFNRGKRQSTFSAHLRRRMAELDEADGEDLPDLPPARDVSRYEIPSY